MKESNQDDGEFVKVLNKSITYEEALAYFT